MRPTYKTHLFFILFLSVQAEGRAVSSKAKKGPHVAVKKGGQTIAPSQNTRVTKIQKQKTITTKKDRGVPQHRKKKLETHPPVISWLPTSIATSLMGGGMLLYKSFYPSTNHVPGALKLSSTDVPTQLSSSSSDHLTSFMNTPSLEVTTSQDSLLSENAPSLSVQTQQLIRPVYGNLFLPDKTSSPTKVSRRQDPLSKTSIFPQVPFYITIIVLMVAGIAAAKWWSSKTREKHRAEGREKLNIFLASTSKLSLCSKSFPLDPHMFDMLTKKDTERLTLGHMMLLCKENNMMEKLRTQVDMLYKDEKSSLDFMKERIHVLEGVAKFNSGVGEWKSGWNGYLSQQDVQELQKEKIAQIPIDQLVHLPRHIIKEFLGVPEGLSEKQIKAFTEENLGRLNQSVYINTQHIPHFSSSALIFLLRKGFLESWQRQYITEEQIAQIPIDQLIHLPRHIIKEFLRMPGLSEKQITALTEEKFAEISGKRSGFFPLFNSGEYIDNEYIPHFSSSALSFLLRKDVLESWQRQHITEEKIAQIPIDQLVHFPRHIIKEFLRVPRLSEEHIKALTEENLGSLGQNVSINTQYVPHFSAPALSFLLRNGFLQSWQRQYITEEQIAQLPIDQLVHFPPDIIKEFLRVPGFSEEHIKALTEENLGSLDKNVSINTQHIPHFSSSALSFLFIHGVLKAKHVQHVTEEQIAQFTIDQLVHLPPDIIKEFLRMPGLSEKHIKALTEENLESLGQNVSINTQYVPHFSAPALSFLLRNDFLESWQRQHITEEQIAQISFCFKSQISFCFKSLKNFLSQERVDSVIIPKKGLSPEHAKLRIEERLTTLMDAKKIEAISEEDEVEDEESVTLSMLAKEGGDDEVPLDNYDELFKDVLKAQREEHALKNVESVMNKSMEIIDVEKKEDEENLNFSTETVRQDIHGEILEEKEGDELSENSFILPKQTDGNSVDNENKLFEELLKTQDKEDLWSKDEPVINKPTEKEPASKEKIIKKHPPTNKYSDLDQERSHKAYNTRRANEHKKIKIKKPSTNE